MHRIKFLTIVDNDITVTTKENVNDADYDDIIIQHLKSYDFCDITYDGSYTIIIVRKYSC